MKPDVVVELHRRSYACLMVMMENRTYTNPVNRREYQAFQQLAEATQLLYAACMNLGLLVNEES